MSLRVTFLGTGVALPQADRGPSATLLRAGTTSVLVDAGSGTLQKLQRAGVDLLDLDALILTHDHLDHFADVLPLLFAFHIPFYQRTTPLEIYGTEETLARIRAVQSVFGDWLTPNDGAIRWRAISRDERFTIGAFTIDTGTVVHSDASVGLRFTDVESGAVVAIPGDTGPTQTLLPLLRDADLAIMECSVPDEFAMETHLNPTAVADIANDAGSVAIALVHRYPLVQNLDLVALIAETYSGSIFLPDDGATLELKEHGISEIKQDASQA